MKRKSERRSWMVSCNTCQEPVGEPYWKGGCACGGDLTPNETALLAVVNGLWHNIKWEPAPNEEGGER